MPKRESCSGHALILLSSESARTVPPGPYLVEQLVDVNTRHVDRPMEFRPLGDSPAVGVVMAPECGASTKRPAPEFDPGMAYVPSRGHGPIRDYETVDTRFVWRTSTPNLPASPAAKTSPQHWARGHGDGWSPRGDDWPR